MTALNKMLSKLSDAPKSFMDKLPEVERSVFGDISLSLKEIEIDNRGNVVPNVKNLKLIASVKARLARLLLTTEYKDAVASFVKEFNAISNLNQQYFDWANLPDSKLLKSVTDFAIDNTLESLTGAGYTSGVVSKLGDMLVKSVTSGSHYADMVEQIRGSLLSSGAKDSVLARYARTYVTDALSQFSGQQIKIIATGIDVEWYRYVGSNKETTREFCGLLTKKEFVHVSELSSVIKGEIDGQKCELNAKTGLPSGMIDGTNEANFMVYCGGYNCQHKMIPVDKKAVPKHFITGQADNQMFVDSYLKKSTSFAADFDKRCQSIATELGYKATAVSIKKSDRIIEKSKSDYNGEVTKCRDIVRNTFIVKESEISHAISTIEKKFKVVRVKHQDIDSFGYSGTIINVETGPGTYAEIQLNTPQMIYGKSASAQKYLGDELFSLIKEKSGLSPGLGHAYYEDARIIGKNQIEERIRLAEASSKYYNKLRLVEI